MLNISFPACTKVELYDLIVCIVVNGEKFQSPTVTLNLIRQCPLSNLSEIVLYTTRYSNFMFLHGLLFDFIVQKHTQTHTHTQRDSDEYSMVAFCKIATTIIGYQA